jgi:NADH dehydrogenase
VTTRVVLVGAGYASVWAYRALVRHLGSQVEVVVVAPDPVHVFHGFTGESIAGLFPLGLAESPWEEVFPRARRVLGRVERVERDASCVHVATPEGPLELPYDHLFIATGAREDTSKVPGAEEFAHRLRAAGEVDALVSALDERLFSALRVTGEERARLSTCVVIGGGFAGTEAAVALAQRAAHLGLSARVVLLSSGAPAPELRDSLRAHVARELARDGVEVVLERARAVDERGVTLASGERVEAATVVAALGNRAQVLPGLEDLLTPGDTRVPVTPELLAAPGVWAAGDGARVPRTRRGRLVGDAPADALWAIRAGTRAGRNIARVAKGRDPKPFTYPGLGRVASYGTGRTAAELYGVPLTGWAGWVLRMGFFLWFVPSRRNMLRLVRAAVLPQRGRVPGQGAEVLVPEQAGALAVPAARS